MNKRDVLIKSLLNDTQVSYTALIAIILLSTTTILSVLAYLLLN